MPENNPLGESVNLLIKIKKYYKPTTFLIGVVGLLIVIKIFFQFGLYSAKSVYAGIFVILAMIVFIGISAVTTENGKIPAFFKYLIMALGMFVPVGVLLVGSCVFFDWPKPFRQLPGIEERDVENLNFVNEKAGDWKTLINFQDLDGESCDYPTMYSSSIFGQDVKSDDVVLLGHVDTVASEIRAPMVVRGKWGFSMPFRIEGITKEAALTITNKFKVRVFADKKALKHANAESNCGGGGYIYAAPENIVLHNDKPYYEKLIEFPQADYYTLKPNEQIAFDLDFLIKDIGTYIIWIDVPYVYRGKKGVATYKLPTFVAPQKYDLWEWSMDISDSTKYPMKKVSTNIWSDNGYNVEPSKRIREQARL